MARSPEKKIDVYTDGACSGNPGAGGYGVVLLYAGHRKELSGGYRWTTNNRMELMALVAALTALKEPCIITIHTDSRYLMGGFEQDWVAKWKNNGWKNSAKDPVQNQDLWKRLDILLAPHVASFRWIKGHAEDQENNRCDLLAVESTRKAPLLIDEEYEASNPFLSSDELGKDSS